MQQDSVHSPVYKRRRSLHFLLAGLILLVTFRALTPLHARLNRDGVLYWHGNTTHRQIALTFDDGPNEPYTSQVLEILRQNHVQATFFLVGENVETYPEAARAIVHDGHVIGNHTYSHRNLIVHSNAAVRREIERGEEAIERVTGQQTHLFRPPYGYKDFLTVREPSNL